MSNTPKSSNSACSDVHDAILEQLGVIERAMTLNKEITEQLMQANHTAESLSNNPYVQRSKRSMETVALSCQSLSDEICQAASMDKLRRPSSASFDSRSCLSSYDEPQIDFGLERHQKTFQNDAVQPLLAQNRMERRDSEYSIQRLDSTCSSKAEIMKRVGAKGSEMRMEAMFQDTREIEAQLRESMQKNEYNVEDFYKKEGIWSDIARSGYFKDFAFVMILFNTIYIGASTDLNDADVLPKAAWQFQIGDNIFCAFFTFELVIRFLAFQSTRFAVQDNWFKFDIVLVLTMIWETWIMTVTYLLFDIGGSDDSAKGVSVFRVFRLLRVFRAVRATRLLDMFPELMILARGIMSGLRSVFAVLCLLALLIYIYAIIFVLQLKGTDAIGGAFESVPVAANVLLLQVLCGPDADFLRDAQTEGYFYYVLLIMFILFAVFTIMNMLIGILCDSVARVSQDEKDTAFANQVSAHLARLAEVVDTDKSGTITHTEFDYIIKDNQLACSFDELNVDLVGVVDFANFIFAQTEEISYINFAQMISQFRGSRSATVKDVTDVRRYVSMELVSLESRLEHYLFNDIMPMLDQIDRAQKDARQSNI